MWNNSCVEVFITECILSLSGLPYSSLATRTPKQRSLLAPAECKWPRQPQHHGYHRRPRWRCLANWSGWKAEKLLMIFKHRPIIVELLVWLFFANLSSPVVSANAGTQRQISFLSWATVFESDFTHDCSVFLQKLDGFVLEGITLLASPNGYH